MFSEQEYDQAIDALMNFSTALRARVEGARSAADTCVVNMEEDVVAKGAAAQLHTSLGRVEEIVDTRLRSLIAGLEEEKERARRLAEDMDDG